jgi:hypothetical protein
MGDTLYQLCARARSLSATQRSKQVTDTEMASWINEGVARLYDELTLADDSYYGIPYDFSVSAGSEAAATAALPANFYRLRGVERWPDTPRAYTLYALSFDRRNTGEAGYILNGDNIQIVPWRLTSMAGPYRLHYVPVPPTFGRALDITPSEGDGIVVGVATTFALQVQRGLFSGVDDQARAIVSGAQYSWDNYRNDMTVPTPNGYQMIWTNGNATATNIDLGDVFSIGLEAFTDDTFVAVVGPVDLATGAPAYPYILELDALMQPYAQFVVAYAAKKALAKKQWPDGVAVCDDIMAKELERVKRSAPRRESEPEVAAPLWEPSWRRRRGGGWW